MAGIHVVVELFGPAKYIPVRWSNFRLIIGMSEAGHETVHIGAYTLPHGLPLSVVDRRYRRTPIAEIVVER
jgi:hypothetical protein